MSPKPASPTFFRSAAEFREWLVAHHATTTELVVGFYRVQTGKPTMTWTESVREALCFGWVDGHVRKIDDERYTRRFTPRTATSIWSSVNIRHAEELIAIGLMQTTGWAAFDNRTEKRSGIYSFEQGEVDLPPAYAKVLQLNETAATFWATQPASYRKAATWWIISAKQEATRQRRLQKLIDHSAIRERLPQFVSNSKKS